MGQDTLQDHDRAVHHDTKINRTQAHQVGRDPEATHQDEGEQHRQRYDGGNDHAGTHIAQENHQHDKDNQGALH